MPASNGGTAAEKNALDKIVYGDGRIKKLVMKTNSLVGKYVTSSRNAMWLSLVIAEAVGEYQWVLS